MLKEKVSALAFNAKLTIKKHSPEILLVLGLVSFGATIYSVRKAAKKEDEVLGPINEQIEELKDEDDGSRESAMELAKLYACKTGRIARLYSWSAIFAGTTVGCIWASNRILRSWYTNLSAAYAILNKKYQDIVARYKDSIQEEQKEEPTGPLQLDAIGMSAYSFYFDDSSHWFKKYAELNYKFIKEVEDTVDGKLRARAALSPSKRGFYFMEELFVEFGIKPTGMTRIASKEIGWMYDCSNPINGKLIDLGADEWFNKRARQGDELVFIISPNVHGKVFYQMTDRDNY